MASLSLAIGVSAASTPAATVILAVVLAFVRRGASLAVAPRTLWRGERVSIAVMDS